MSQLLRKESDLQYLTNLKAAKGTDCRKEWLVGPAFPGFRFLLSVEQTPGRGPDSEASLDEVIKKLESNLKRARKKEAGELDDRPQEELSFPLLDVPDADVRALPC
jgi:actin-related protein 5